MKIQTLVATMNQTNIKELLEKMNIETDAIITNQTSDFSDESFKFKSKDIQVYNFKEKGIGLNRNNALMRANADIVLFADDDMKYKENYEKIILDEFNKNPKADMILFNLCNNDTARPRYIIKRIKRIHKYNCLRYGAVRMAVKLDRIRQNNIYFSLLFGGGAKYGSGEDSIFIYNCIKSGLKAYSSPKEILTIEESESTWFNGYNEKYFYDKGALLSCIFKRKSFFMIPVFLFKNRNMAKKFGIKEAYKMMKKGCKEFKKSI